MHSWPDGQLSAWVDAPVPTLLSSARASFISENAALTSIGPGAFSDLPELLEL